jgi:thioredoxin reductase
VVDGGIEQLVIDDDQLRGVQMNDGCVVPRDALFVPPRFVPNNQLIVDLCVEVDDDGWVSTDGAGRTSVPGVWAAGNLVDPRAQVITAAGAGSASAMALNATSPTTTSAMPSAPSTRASRPHQPGTPLRSLHDHPHPRTAA